MQRHLSNVCLSRAIQNAKSPRERRTQTPSLRIADSKQRGTLPKTGIDRMKHSHNTNTETTAIVLPCYLQPYCFPRQLPPKPRCLSSTQPAAETSKSTATKADQSTLMAKTPSRPRSGMLTRQNRVATRSIFCDPRRIGYGVRDRKTRCEWHMHRRRMILPIDCRRSGRQGLRSRRWVQWHRQVPSPEPARPAIPPLHLNSTQ